MGSGGDKHGRRIVEGKMNSKRVKLDSTPDDINHEIKQITRTLDKQNHINTTGSRCLDVSVTTSVSPNHSTKED